MPIKFTILFATAILAVSLTILQLFYVLLTHAQDTRFVCTEFIGYSQTNNWIGGAATTMNAGGTDRVQLKWQSGGAAFRWADPAYVGWTAAPQSPCASNSGSPDRLILDITHNDYLDSDMPFPGTTTPVPNAVDWMEQTIRNLVATAKSYRITAANNIVLQAVVGHPSHGTCPIAGAQQHGVVRASWNHPFILTAMQRVAANTPGVTIGYDAHVRTCADYLDWEGHLTDSSRTIIGQSIGTYYRDLNLQQLTPTPTSLPTPTNTSLPTNIPFPTNTPTLIPTDTPTLIPTNTPLPLATADVIPTATPLPKCFSTVRLTYDGIMTFIDEVPCSQ